MRREIPGFLLLLLLVRYEPRSQFGICVSSLSKMDRASEGDFRKNRIIECSLHYHLPVGVLFFRTKVLSLFSTNDKRRGLWHIGETHWYGSTGR